MATIRKLVTQKGVSYKAIIKDNTGAHLKSKNFARLVDAKAWAKRIEGDTEHMEALGMAGSGMTFSQLLDEYMRQWTGRDPNQYYRLEYWRKRLGPIKLIDLTPQLLRQQLKAYQEGQCLRGDGRKRSKTLDKPRAPASVNRHRVTISGALTYAFKSGYINANPMHKVSGLSMNNMRVRYLSDDERARLFDICKQSAWDKLYLLVIMATCTGMRKGELLGLRWSDIDFDESLAYLTLTKNGEPRVCPIPSPAMSELKKYRGVGSQLIFPSEKMPGRPFEFKRHWDKALKMAGVERFTFHCLKTYGRELSRHEWRVIARNGGDFRP